MSVTPSAEVVGLGFVERLGFGSLLGLGTWLGIGRLGDRQLRWLGMLLAPGRSYDLAHQHADHPQKWGDEKSPTLIDK